MGGLELVWGVELDVRDEGCVMLIAVNNDEPVPWFMEWFSPSSSSESERVMGEDSNTHGRMSRIKIILHFALALGVDGGYGLSDARCRWSGASKGLVGMEMDGKGRAASHFEDGWPSCLGSLCMCESRSCVACSRGTSTALVNASEASSAASSS